MESCWNFWVELRTSGSSHFPFAAHIMHWLVTKKIVISRLIFPQEYRWALRTVANKFPSLFFCFKGISDHLCLLRRIYTSQRVTIVGHVSTMALLCVEWYRQDVVKRRVLKYEHLLISLSGLVYYGREQGFHEQRRQCEYYNPRPRLYGKEQWNLTYILSSISMWRQGLSALFHKAILPASCHRRS